MRGRWQPSGWWTRRDAEQGGEPDPQGFQDLGAQLARLDQPAERLQPLPVAVGAERFARDAPLQLGGRTQWETQEDRPAALAHHADGVVLGLATGAVPQQVDPAGDRGSRSGPRSARIGQRMPLLSVAGSSPRDGARGGRPCHDGAASGDRHRHQPHASVWPAGILACRWQQSALARIPGTMKDQQRPGPLRWGRPRSARSATASWISYALYVGVALLWFVPDRRFTPW
jgi:hypothetical protein